MGNQRIRVFAPATVANIGPGFDVLGLALSSPGDLLDAELSDTPGVEIVEITGDGGRLSRDAMKNVAEPCRRPTCCAAREARKGCVCGCTNRCRSRAGSEARAPAARQAPSPRTNCSGGRCRARDVVLSAMEGECAASGTPHADNVAPSVMGGFVLVRSYDPFEIVAAAGARRTCASPSSIPIARCRPPRRGASSTNARTAST